jgi:hypothetical protein
MELPLPVLLGLVGIPGVVALCMALGLTGQRQVTASDLEGFARSESVDLQSGQMWIELKRKAVGLALAKDGRVIIARSMGSHLVFRCLPAAQIVGLENLIASGQGTASIASADLGFPGWKGKLVRQETGALADAPTGDYIHVS